MLRRLTKTRRLMAGRLLALTYLFCVLAPAMSFAFADGARAAPCLTKDEHGGNIVHVHGGVAKHVHEDGLTHHHSLSAAAPDGEQLAGPAADSDSLPLDHHKSSGGQCCGMACVNALPATVVELVRPIAPRSICHFTEYRAVDDNGPPQLYRPPIA
jgi:hypothetical protein